MARYSWIFQLIIGMTLIIGFPLLAQSSTTIYRCTGSHETAYQNFPCTAGMAQEVVEHPAPRVTATTSSASNPKLSASGASTAYRADDSRTGMPFQRRRIALGMTDDEVLNLPQWGRPVRITRSRGNLVWHEEWTYGRKRLRFENTRLTAIEDVPQQVASLAQSGQTIQ